MLEFDGAQLRSFRAPPPSHQLTTTLPSRSSRRPALLVTKSWDRFLLHNNPQHGCGCQISSSLNSPDGGGVGDWLFCVCVGGFFFFVVGDFSKKAENQF